MHRSVPGNKQKQFIAIYGKVVVKLKSGYLKLINYMFCSFMTKKKKTNGYSPAKWETREQMCRCADHRCPKFNIHDAGLPSGRRAPRIRTTQQVAVFSGRLAGQRNLSADGFTPVLVQKLTENKAAYANAGIKLKLQVFCLFKIV